MSTSDTRADAPDMQVKIEQSWQQIENTPEREERQVPTSTTSELAEERERLSSEQHTVKLVREVSLSVHVCVHPLHTEHLDF